MMSYELPYLRNLSERARLIGLELASKPWTHRKGEAMQPTRRQAQELECCWCGNPYHPEDSTASEPLRYYLCSEQCENQWRKEQEPE